MERITLYTILTIGLLWGVFTQPDNIWVLTYKICYSVPFWAYPLILSYDLWFTISGKNSKQVASYYKSISLDLMTGVLLAVFIIVLSYLAGTNYSNSSIDIGAFGASFVILGMLKLFKVSRYKIVGMPINTKFIFFMAACIFGFIILMLSSLSEIMKGELELWQSIWLQITFLSVSIFVLVEVGRVVYFIENSEMSPSLGFLTFFEHIGSKHKLYENAAVQAENWNKEIKITKAKRSAKLRRKRNK
jgi:hypothetical protein